MRFLCVFGLLVLGFAVQADAEPVPRPRLVAHRGASDLTMPEASRPAYRNAVTSGSDIVKLDLQRTKDGVIVMGHDPTLKRNMGWDVCIADVDYAEILEKGTFIAKGGYAQEKILRLDEALDIVKPVPEFWIDFKAFDPDFAERVLKAFQKAGIDESRIMVATFSKPALEHFQSRHPNIRRVGHIFLKRQADGSWKGNAGKGKTLEDMMASVLRYRDQLGLFGVNMPVSQGQTRPQDVEFLRKNGLWVSLWFVQDAKSAAAYRTCGADAFVTDFASRVLKRKENEYELR